MRLCLVGKNPEYVLAYRRSLISAAQARGHEVHALTASSSVSAATASSEGAAESTARLVRARTRLAEAGVTLHTVSIDGGGVNPLRDLRTMRALAQQLRAIRPDAVLCYNPKLVAYGPRAARRAGVPRVGAMVTGLGYAFTGLGLRRRVIRTIAARLFRRSLAACDVVFFQNRDDLALFTRIGIVSPTPATQARPTKGPRIAMIAGSGVDLERFAETALPPSPTLRFVMIARLLRDKGAYEFVEAARLVRAQLPHATFALVGGVDDNPTAVQPRELAQWRSEGIVELPGEVEDVREALRASSVFVLPSHREGTSKVMLEAMATGRAVITTDATGCREPIEPGINGLLVPVNNAQALADAMIALGRDHDRLLAMGRASRRIAIERFDATRVDALILDALGL